MTKSAGRLGLRSAWWYGRIRMEGPGADPLCYAPLCPQLGRRRHLAITQVAVLRNLAGGGALQVRRGGRPAAIRWPRGWIQLLPIRNSVRDETARPMRSRAVRTLLIVAGTLSVAMGVIGMFVPLLPTTPFLLLAAAAYARSSDRFHRWLLTNRFCGDYIRNYREGRGLALRQKVLTIALLWLAIGVSAIVFIEQWWIRFLLFGIAVGVTIHLVRVPTCRREEESPGEVNGVRVSEGADR